MGASELINWSEFSVLTQCERKYVYQYVLREDEPGEKRGLHLGSLCHKWHSEWLLGNGATLPSEWTDDIGVGGKPGDTQTLCLTNFDPELVERATWLAGRFVAVYGQQPPSSWTVISAEEWLIRDFTWGTLVGRTDGFVEIDGQLWLIEVKTYGSKPGPLAYCHVSPQLGCYSLLAEAKYGQRPYGILYQGIYTYQWKPKKPTLAELREQTGCSLDEARVRQHTHPGVQRPPEESFQQEWPELGEDHLRTAERFLFEAVNRRRQLSTLGAALPSIGQQCRNCGFRPRCWNDLGGVEEYEIEVEDDDAEPV